MAEKIEREIDEREAPPLEVLEQMADAGYSKATDGCTVEPDGECKHGYRSWLIELGLI
ncbi:MAG: hypothetical protein M3209_00090 [Acidobacteriota bacterium]|nr:hypothetical protein [Acidobacteriota bacterium]